MTTRVDAEMQVLSVQPNWVDDVSERGVHVSAEPLCVMNPAARRGRAEVYGIGEQARHTIRFRSGEGAAYRWSSKEGDEARFDDKSRSC